MSDAAAPKVVKKKAAAKPKKPADHPKYSEMIKTAISSLKERGGSSRQAILKYILANFNVGKDERQVNAHLKLALRAGVKNASLKQAKGTGASGSFRLGEVKKAAKPKKAKKPKAAKPKPKKATKPKKPAAKKSPKKANKPAEKLKKAAAKAKKPAAKAKKPAAKKPAAKAKKPAAKAKKPAAKKAAKK